MAFDGYRSDPKPPKRPMVFGVLGRKAPPPVPPAITLLTDFGTDDIYVGVMKGVLQRIAPNSTGRCTGWWSTQVSERKGGDWRCGARGNTSSGLTTACCRQCCRTPRAGNGA